MAPLEVFLETPTDPTVPTAFSFDLLCEIDQLNVIHYGGDGGTYNRNECITEKWT